MDPALLTSVADSTDFPPSHLAPGLRELDASLRPYILNLIKGHVQRQEPTTPRPKKRKITPDTVKRSGASTSTGTSSLGTPSKPKRAKQTSSDTFGPLIPTSDAEEDELPEPTRVDKVPRPDDLVDCPLCSKRVKFKTINQHMDKGCKDTPPTSANSTTADWKKLMAKPSSKGKQKDNSDDEDDYPLPKATYATLKDKKIKEMLVEYGLPTSGDRQQWILRHQRSARNRKSKDELKRELKKMEEPKKKKTTVDDTVAHEKRHKGEFARLIAAARPRPDKGGGTSTPATGQ
ncbi:hypothetical protein DXG01_013268 [Tephrocybe rancida]|nr:hypothetical protein DXG01_013268 [Tephrocybe rancida]